MAKETVVRGVNITLVESQTVDEETGQDRDWFFLEIDVPNPERPGFFHCMEIDPWVYSQLMKKVSL